MERMGTEYQIFNGKEYVSLRRFWNMEGKYKTEKAKNEKLEQENKKLEEEIKDLVKRNIEYEKKYKIVLGEKRLVELALEQASRGEILI